LKGKLWTIALYTLINPQEEIAVKSWSMKILMALAKKYPEIIPELKLIVADQYDQGSAGFKSQAKNIMVLK
jgi:hypothetical protein